MNLKSSSKSGFTLIELLVVMLILVILTVTALPAIREYMIRARYTADVDPAIGNIRTKVELYRYEHDHLPGMQLAEGTAQLADDSVGNDYSAKVITSYVPAQHQNAYIHTMSYNEVTTEESGIPSYMEEEFTGATDLTDGTITQGDLVRGEDDVSNATNPDKALTWHAFKQCELSYNDLRARFVAPYNFQYAVIYNKGEDYCWVVGAMGTGGGLPVGTGYAVLEYCNTTLKTKFIATFERYKAESSRKPLTLSVVDFGATQNGLTFDATDPAASQEAVSQYVIIDSVQYTFPDTAGQSTVTDLERNLAAFKTALTVAGWKVE